MCKFYDDLLHSFHVNPVSCCKVKPGSGLTSLSSSLLTINIFEIVIRQLNEHQLHIHNFKVTKCKSIKQFMKYTILGNLEVKSSTHLCFKATITFSVQTCREFTHYVSILCLPYFLAVIMNETARFVFLFNLILRQKHECSEEFLRIFCTLLCFLWIGVMGNSDKTQRETM